MRKKLTLIVVALMLCFPAFQKAEAQYKKQNEISKIANDLASSNPSVCKITNLGKSIGGKDLQVLTIGKGDVDNKPAIAIIGGVEGNHNLGRELALGFASSIIRDASKPEVSALLSKVTFYIFPDASPDATDRYFSELKYEQTGNNRQVDNDRDFVNGEDPFEDLNNDGYITMIRIADPSGTYIPYSEDDRIMVPADLTKGEKGKYIIITEGTDNDEDGDYNEDGPGGVNFNKNLSYNFEEFGTEAGDHPVSEPESKAILDFLFDHFNIYATFAFGPQDNLGQPLKGSSASQASAGAFIPGASAGSQGQMRMMGSRRFTSVKPSDEVINKLVSGKYLEVTGFKGAPATRNTPGNFMEWSYYHYGRYSFSTPGWWVSQEKEKNPDAAFLKYAADNGFEDVFVPWTPVKHPAFEGRTAEAGGIKPFVKINPPASMLKDLVEKHYNFIIEVAKMHPELEISDLKTEDIGNGIYRVSLKILNKGLFATMAESGESNNQTRLMQLTMQSTGNQKILSGQPVQRIQRLQSNETASFSWLISGKGSVKISAGAINTGFVETTVTLK